MRSPSEGVAGGFQFNVAVCNYKLFLQDAMQCDRVVVGGLVFLVSAGLYGEQWTTHDNNRKCKLTKPEIGPHIHNKRSASSHLLCTI